jgi:hypothetical protein
MYAIKAKSDSGLVVVAFHLELRVSMERIEMCCVLLKGEPLGVVCSILIFLIFLLSGSDFLGTPSKAIFTLFSFINKDGGEFRETCLGDVEQIIHDSSKNTQRSD